MNATPEHAAVGHIAPGVLAKTTVPAVPFSIYPAQAWVLAFGKHLGFDDEGLNKLELLVEEALMSVVATSFEGGQVAGAIDVSIESRPGEFVLAVEDRGLPMDLKRLEESEGTRFSMVLMKELLEQFNFINKGNAGKRLELVMRLPSASLLEELHRRAQARAEEDEQAAKELVAKGTSLCFLGPEDALGLAQLAYSAYGYSYVSMFYQTDVVAQRLRQGLLRTAVAKVEDGRIAGSLSLMLDSEDSRVGESGAAMVDPKFRGGSIFKNLKLFLVDEAKRMGLYGMLSEAVTIHPYTQKGNLTLGARECGLLVSYVSDNVAFAKIENRLEGQRQACVYFFLKTNEAPHRKVYLPAIYKEWGQRIYASLGVPRTIEEPTQATAEDSRGKASEGETVLELQVRKDLFNDASIYVRQLGADALPMVLQHTRELIGKRTDVIYLSLPAQDPAAAHLAGELASHGYLFCGLIPELDHGDVLKLQYLNHLAVDPERIQVVSDFAKDLLAFILKQYKAFRA